MRSFLALALGSAIAAVIVLLSGCGTAPASAGPADGQAQAAARLGLPTPTLATRTSAPPSAAITPLIEASCPSPLLLESLARGARTDEQALLMRIAMLEKLYADCRAAVFAPPRRGAPGAQP